MRERSADPVSLTIVRNELEAELVCQLLRSEGVRCVHRITNAGFGMGGEMPMSGGGPREIVVRPDDLVRASELLAAFASEASDDQS